jgi:hypothetical protein
MDYETSGSAEIAAAIAGEIGREVDYRPVGTGGAARGDAAQWHPPARICSDPHVAA